MRGEVFYYCFTAVFLDPTVIFHVGAQKKCVVNECNQGFRAGRTGVLHHLGGSSAY